MIAVPGAVPDCFRLLKPDCEAGGFRSSVNSGFMIYLNSVLPAALTCFAEGLRFEFHEHSRLLIVIEYQERI